MDVSLDGSTNGFAGRMEILEDRSGRRNRSEAERARIAAESLVPGVRVADVARRHEVTRYIGNPNAGQQTFRRDPRPLALTPQTPARTILEYLHPASKAVR